MLSIVLLGCRDKKDNEIYIPIVSEDGIRIGDSVLLNQNLSKLVFVDSSLWIDSIVYYYSYFFKKIQAIKTYKRGREVLENISFHSNGSVKTYEFVSSVNENYFYRRDYDTNGVCINSDGEVFLEKHFSKIDPNTREVIDDGDRMHIRVFYPQPPDCKSFVFVTFADSLKMDVFKQNKIIGFLKEVWVDTEIEDKEWSAINFGMEMICKNDTLQYEKMFYFKAVKAP